MEIRQMKRYCNGLIRSFLDRKKYVAEDREKTKDSDDMGDLYRSSRYDRQLGNDQQEIRVWVFLIKNKILVLKPGNRKVRIKHPISNTIINYMTLSFKAQIKGHGWQKMGLYALKKWYFSKNDKFILA